MRRRRKAVILHVYICSELFTQTAYLLDNLSSIWAGPFTQQVHRADGTGPVYSTGESEK